MVAVADRRQGEAAVLPGFEHLHRYWDPAQSRMTVKVLPATVSVPVRGVLVVFAATL